MDKQTREGVKLLAASNSNNATANCNSRVKLISHVTGRCALFNVKLHFFLFFPPTRVKILIFIFIFFSSDKGQNTLV